jgi:ectoine hydroxylase-related dioxygenase (phytanoyl-CoA dioxygenase family)
MLRRINDQNWIRECDAPAGALELEQDGYHVLRGEFDERELAVLKFDIERIFETCPPDMRPGRTSTDNAAMFRYEMFNRSLVCQRAIARPNVLAIVDALLGSDCHAINCTAWRNPPGVEHAPWGQEWHTDGGPHVPRRRDTPWPAHIPYPIFVIGTHIFLEDVRLEDGPTACVPGSHTSGCIPPHDRVWDLELEYLERRSEPMLARAGDVGFFVSDVWHRRIPPSPQGRGRFFLQTNYGRREIAQRIRTTDVANQVSPEAAARAVTDRERDLIGLHRAVYYDG